MEARMSQVNRSLEKRALYLMLLSLASIVIAVSCWWLRRTLALDSTSQNLLTLGVIFGCVAWLMIAVAMLFLLRKAPRLPSRGSS
jgi:hypothetical protein